MSSQYGYRWQKLCRLARNTYAPRCHLCGGEIDTTLPHTHAYSWTLDHLDPATLYGSEVPSIDRVRPAHRYCNGARAASPLSAVSPRSEDW